MTPPTPEEHLMQAVFGFMLSRGLTVAAALRVADHLRDGPRYYTDLAKAVGADQRALHRLMRMLVSAGIFAETSPGTYAQNEVSDMLRSDHPRSFRAMAEMITSDSHWFPWGKLEDVVRTGLSGPQHAFGTDIFSWFQKQENRDEWDIFNEAMTSFSAGVTELVLETFDFSNCRKIVDIGGGHGLLLRSILEANPGASGVLFDLPGVVGDADDLDGRIERVGGSFFEEITGGGDTYLLKHIIHDWGDGQCVTILRNIANVMNPNGQVLVIEMVMPETTEVHPAKFMDINMLAMTEGGCERTRSQYSELFEAAGLRLDKVYPTRGIVSILQAKKK